MNYESQYLEWHNGPTNTYINHQLYAKSKRKVTTQRSNCAKHKAISTQHGTTQGVNFIIPFATLQKT